MKNLRQKQILELLEEKGTVNTIALAEQLSVSIETIRRDFSQLEQLGALKKIYGGAELNIQATPHVSSFASRRAYMNKTKAALGKQAATYITDNSVVALDSGSTVFECIQQVSGKTGVTYICTDVHCAVELLSHENADVYILGGKLTPYGTSSSTFAKEFLAPIAEVNLLIMSVDGASPDSGLSSDEANVNYAKQRFLKKANRTVAIIDHTKFMKRGFYKTCDFTDIDVLVTDSGTPRPILAKIRELGVTVDVVECPAEDTTDAPRRTGHGFAKA